jgi:hypothetical protein
MEDKEYSEFVLKDTGISILHAVGIYAAALGFFWFFIG